MFINFNFLSNFYVYMCCNILKIYASFFYFKMSLINLNAPFRANSTISFRDGKLSELIYTRPLLHWKGGGGLTAIASAIDYFMARLIHFEGNKHLFLLPLFRIFSHARPRGPNHDNGRIKIGQWQWHTFYERMRDPSNFGPVDILSFLR